VVIGAGHNGLVCAAYLAKAGLRTLVLEGSGRVGGALATGEIEPGVRAPTYAHTIGRLRSSVVRDLRLTAHGLRTIRPDVRAFAPQPDGRRAPGTKDAHAAALIAQLGPDEFLVTGVDASISFHLPGKLPWMRSEIITAEQGAYQNGEWKLQKLWNGDETDRGLCFHDKPEVVRVRLGRF